VGSGYRVYCEGIGSCGCDMEWGVVIVFIVRGCRVGVIWIGVWL
jgi:hypothetical protein